MGDSGWDSDGAKHYNDGMQRADCPCTEAPERGFSIRSIVEPAPECGNISLTGGF
jgi:hypothetical protein